MAKRAPKTPSKPKNPRAETEAEHFADVARKIFKVPKAEVDSKAKKP